MNKQEIIKGLERFRPFELGDDPVRWSQSNTVDRIAEWLETVLVDEEGN